MSFYSMTLIFVWFIRVFVGMFLGLLICCKYNFGSSRICDRHVLRSLRYFLIFKFSLWTFCIYTSSSLLSVGLGITTTLCYRSFLMCISSTIGFIAFLIKSIEELPKTILNDLPFDFRWGAVEGCLVFIYSLLFIFMRGSSNFFKLTISLIRFLFFILTTLFCDFFYISKFSFGTLFYGVATFKFS